MELGILWGEWIAQPPEHRALYLSVRQFQNHMDAYDDGWRAMKRYNEKRKNAAGKGRR